MISSPRSKSGEQPTKNETDNFNECFGRLGLAFLVRALTFGFVLSSPLINNSSTAMNKYCKSERYQAETSYPFCTLN
jgi:hypothetical protein